jgi:hypothetical protein
MHNRTDRDVAQWQAVSSLDWRCRTRLQNITRFDTAGRYDVAALTVSEQQQSNMRCTIWVVLETLYLRGNSIFGALEINDAIVLLMTTTDVTRGDASVVISTTAARLRLNERAMRRALMQISVDNADL